MVAIRNHRFGVETLQEAAAQAAVHRVSYEAAVEATGAGTVRNHRFGVEVLAQVQPKVGVTRHNYEAAVEATGAGTVRNHRFGVEVLLSNLAKIGIGRVSYEAAVNQVVGGLLRLHRFGIELLARSGVPNPVPLALGANIEFFMHNWVDELTIETAYMTDVNRSPQTLAEERRSLIQRPERTLTLHWLRMDATEVYQLRRLLRRLTSENLQLPLYPDAIEVGADAPLGTETDFTVNVENRRFYVGARVLFFETSKTYLAVGEVKTGIITELTATQIKIDAALGVAVLANKWSVVPLIDCEILLDPQITWETAEVANVNLTVREFRGKNALPPTSLGLTSGFPVRLGRPVFEIEPNWIRGIRTTYKRIGNEQRVGRRTVPLLDGTRYSQFQDWNLSPLERADWYRVMRMFDTRRGRGESFWAIDREFTWDLALTSSVFIDVVPFGTFADFNPDGIWTDSNIAAAIVMKDGEIHLAQINTVVDNTSTWRLTLVGGQTIDDPIDLTQVEYFAMARISRFNTDAMKERWLTNNVCSVRLKTIELQNEKDVDFD